MRSEEPLWSISLPAHGLEGLEPAYRVGREKGAKGPRTPSRLRQGAGLGGAPVGRGYKASRGGGTVERKGRGYEARRGREKLPGRILYRLMPRGALRPARNRKRAGACVPAGRRGGGWRKGGVVKPHRACQRGAPTSACFAWLRGASGRGQQPAGARHLPQVTAALQPRPPPPAPRQPRRSATVRPPGRAGFRVPLRAAGLGVTTIGEWDGEWASAAAACEVSGRGGPPSAPAPGPAPSRFGTSASRRGSPGFTSPTDFYSS